MKFLSLLAAALLSISAQPPTSSPAALSSQTADYDGACLVLTGDVAITHELANMQAEKARIERQEQNPAQPLTSIELENNVRLSLPPTSNISCQKAYVDFTTLSAHLQGSSQHPIMYTDSLIQKNSKTPLPLHLSSQALEIFFVEGPATGKKPSYALNKLIATDHVILQYGTEWKLFTEKADYQNLPSAQPSTMEGTFTAYSVSPENLCVLFYKDQQIRSNIITVDMSKSELKFIQPIGTLPSCFSEESTLTFHANTLDWNQIDNRLFLQGNIHIEDPTIGILEAQEGITMHLNAKDKQPLESLHTLGPSHLTYLDTHKLEHHLFSQGPITLESKTGHIEMTTPQGSSQVRYENAQFSILADNVVVHYIEEKEKMSPEKLLLSGNVRLISRDTTKPTKIGLADSLVYTFSSQQCLLSAQPGKHVLIEETQGGMHLSAPQVQISCASPLKEPQIQGIGAVHFGFTAEEESKVKQFLSQLEHMP